VQRPVTETVRLRSIRVISGWPCTWVMVATRDSGRRWPSGARIGNCPICSIR
jgi:hypothetical protein